MKIKQYIFFTSFILSATLLCQPAVAKDLIFHMGNEMIQVIDTDDDSLRTIPIKGAARDSVISADKKFMYVTGSRRNIQILDLEKMQIIKNLKVEEKGWERLIYGIAVNHDNKTAYVSVFSRRTDKGEAVVAQPEILQIDLANGKILRSLAVPFGVVSLILVENDTKMYAVSQDIFTIEILEKELKIKETTPVFARGINIFPLWHYTYENDGIWLSPYYSAEGMGLMSINTKTGKITETMLQGEPPFAYNAIYSPDKTKAYAVMDEIAIIDLKSKTYEKIVPIPEGTCYGVMPTTDGKKLYAGAGGSTITVFDVATMTPLKVLQMETDGMGLRRISL